MTDTDYEIARNSLIPHATRYANSVHGKGGKKFDTKWMRKWNITFLAEMDRLTNLVIFQKRRLRECVTQTARTKTPKENVPAQEQMPRVVKTQKTKSRWKIN